MKTFPTLYHRTATGAVNTWIVRVEGSSVITDWGQADGARQTATVICNGKNLGKKNATTGEQQALKEAEALWKKQVRKKYSESLESVDEDHAISPMLAKSWDDFKKKVSYPLECQAKFDGLRALAYLKNGSVVIQSRGSKFYKLPHLEQQLALVLRPGIILDGELFHQDLDLQTINSLVRKPRKESEQIQYWVYDQVNDKTFKERYQELCLNILDNSPKSIVCVPTYTCDSEDEVNTCHRLFVEEGFEGAIVRTADGMYRAGYRSPDLLRVKSWQTNEYEIVGHKVGKGRFENVPMLICKLPNGETFDVTPTGTMEQRKELLDNISSLIGKMYTVKYFQLSPYGTPLYPTGISVREEHE